MDLHILDIRTRLSAARLPAIPQVLLQLIARCESDDAGMAALAEILANDVALSARVLRVATSPAYHCGSHPANLERALTTIGVDMVRTLLITESVYQTFSETASASGVDLQSFWVHAIATAVTARFVARKMGYAQAEEAYLGGLLHDIGRLALLAAAPEEYAVNFHADDSPALCALEERTLEITHAEAGAWLLERLNLDSFLADSVRYHHDPLQRLVNAHPLVRATAAADRIVECTDAAELAKLENLTGISTQDLQAHYEALDAQVAAIARLLGIDLQEGAVASAVGHPSSGAVRSSSSSQLGEKVRDFILVSKATEGLRKLSGVDACCHGIAGAAIILFDLSDAIIFTLAPSGKMLMPAGLQEGRQRLAGLGLPLDGDGIAASLGRSDGVAFHVPPRQPSVAEEQLLRVFDTDSLVAVRLGTPIDSSGILLGAVSSGQALHLQTRLQLLRDFGVQAGIAIAGATRKAQAESGVNAAMAADFQLASRRVAHEISNPLTVIKNYLAVLNRKAGGDQAIGTDLAILDEEIDRVAQIVNEFSTSQQSFSDDESQIDAALDYACRLFQYSESVNPGVQIECVPAQSVLMAAVSPRKLHQILVNLIKNANEAMPGGGRIELRNRGVVQRDGRDFASLSVGDSGPGIPAEILGRLFSPVQSSKGGAHRGLGLSIVHELVSGAGGQVSCRSDKAGTVFEVLLPLATVATALLQPVSQPEEKK